MFEKHDFCDKINVVIGPEGGFTKNEEKIQWTLVLKRAT